MLDSEKNDSQNYQIFNINFNMLLIVVVVRTVTCINVQFNVLTLALLFSKLKVKISEKNHLEPLRKTI